MPMSDNTATMDDLKAIIAKFCDERDWTQFHNNKDLAIGMVTEASELLEIFRFKDEAQIGELMAGPRREEVIDELADSLYFTIRFAQLNGIDLSSAMERKIGKNSMKYPVEQSKGCNLKYDEY